MSEFASTALRDFIRDTAHTPAPDKMWPMDIFILEEKLSQVRSEVLPNVSLLRRPAFDLVMRRLQRRASKAKHGLIEGYTKRTTPLSALHISRPTGAGISWEMCRPIVMKRGEKKLLDLAHAMRGDVLHNFIVDSNTPEHPLVDILSHARDLENKTGFPDPINPVKDWVNCVLYVGSGAMLDNPRVHQSLDLILSIGFDINQGYAETGSALFSACKQVNAYQGQRRDLIPHIIDLLLERGAKYDSFIQAVPPQAKAYIDQSSVVRRARLKDLVSSHGRADMINHPTRPTM